jgi:hypothetical protein
VLFALNGGGRSRRFTLPELSESGRWTEVLNTARPGTRPVKTNAVSLVARSCILFRHELI